MPKAKKGAARKRARKRVLKAAEGFWGGRSKLYRKAKETILRAGVFAYRDRKVRKREFRRLWIVRIGAAARQRGLSYSHLMNGLEKAGIDIDRKMLAEMAVKDAQGFDRLVEAARAQIQTA